MTETEEFDGTLPAWFSDTGIKLLFSLKMPVPVTSKLLFLPAMNPGKMKKKFSQHLAPVQVHSAG
jgi:hypothetical protein